MLIGFAFQSLSEKTNGEVTLGFAESGGGQPLGLSVVQVDHGRIVARRTADHRPALLSGGIRNHDKERGGPVPMPSLPDLPNRDHVWLRVGRAVDYFEPIRARTSPAVGRTDAFFLRHRIAPAALNCIDLV